MKRNTGLLLILREKRGKLKKILLIVYYCGYDENCDS